MIHLQNPHDHPPRFYAYCKCGVCGPIRFDRDLAKADDRAHREVCSSEQARVKRGAGC